MQGKAFTFQSILVASALGLTFIMGGAAMGLQPAWAGSTEIIEIKSTSGSEDVKIEIIRGGTSDFEIARPDVPDEDLQRYELIDTAGGWFIDNENKRFGNCFTINTAEWRKRAIRCVWKPLPK